MHGWRVRQLVCSNSTFGIQREQRSHLWTCVCGGGGQALDAARLSLNVVIKSESMRSDVDRLGYVLTQDGPENVRHIPAGALEVIGHGPSRTLAVMLEQSMHDHQVFFVGSRLDVVVIADHIVNGLHQ